MNNNSSIPKDQAEEISKQYQILINNPIPEEEERIHQELIQIFSKLKSQITSSPELAKEIELISNLLVDWDPLDYWFVELKTLPRVLHKFVKIYCSTSPNESKIETTPKNSLDDLDDSEEYFQIDENQQEIIQNRINLINKKMELFSAQIMNQKEKLIQLDKEQKPNELQIPTKNHSLNELEAPKIHIDDSDQKLNRSISSSPSQEKDFSKQILTSVDENQEKPMINPIEESEEQENFSKEEIEKIVELEQYNPQDISIIEKISVRHIGDSTNEEILFQNEDTLLNSESIPMISTNEKESEINYQKLIKLRAKLNYFQVNREEISENFKRGLINEKGFQTFSTQNSKEINIIKEKIEALRILLKDEIPS